MSLADKKAGFKARARVQLILIVVLLAVKLHLRKNEVELFDDIWLVDVLSHG
jgi:hypothetical protein